MAFGEYLRTQRKKYGMSQRVLAELIDVSNTEISRIESGERQKPSPTIIRKISEIMHIPLEELMHEAGYTPQTNPSEAVKLNERKFLNIIENYLEKNDWSINREDSAGSGQLPCNFRWDIIAKNLSGRKWVLEYVHIYNDQKMYSILLDKVLSRIGRATLDQTINKLSIVVSGKEIFDVLANLTPSNISLDISVILLDFNTKRLVQENYISEV